MRDRYPSIKFLVFAAVCLGFSVWLIGVIGNVSFEDRVSYTAEFDDVMGLLVNDDVKISGVTVGKVTGMRVKPGGTALVDFEVNSDIVLGTETVVEVRWRSILGQRFVYLIPAGEGDLASTRVAADGDGDVIDFPNERSIEPANIGVLLERLTPVMRALDPEKANLVVEALSEALAGQTDEVRALIREGGSLTQTLADREDEIGSLLANAATVVDAYASREQQLRRLLDSFAEVGETIAARNDGLEGAIVDIADAQEELRRLIDANDEELRLALGELDVITSILSVNQDRLDAIAEFAYQGVVAYHHQSRWGQWFNVRGVGVSLSEQFVESERGAQIPCNNPDGCSFGGEDRTGMASFFGADVFGQRFGGGA